jgi:hypothetical protein
MLWLVRWLRPAVLCAVALTAAAQTPTPAARKADPLDARAGVPATAYESAFSRYRRTADGTAIPWRESNDTAARIGGWRAYAREAQRPEPGASAPAAPPATRPVPGPAPRPTEPDPKAMPMPRGHGGHKMP